VPDAGFYGMIGNIDANVGRMLEFLQRRGLADDTILIFLTDNGSTFGLREGRGFDAGMRGRKGSHYEGGHRVPCFIRWPAGDLAGGRDVDTLAAHLDLYPTLLELCQLERPAGPELHGRSLVPLLRGREVGWADRVLVVDSQRRELMEEGLNFSVMSRSWRLCSGDELYDLRSDPRQTTNLADRHPDVVEQLKGEYRRYWRSIAPMNETYVRIVLGHPAENPGRLTCHDWHTDNQGVPWHQSHVRSAFESNGFWAVDVSQAGRYRLELRRWPKEVGLPIDSPLPEDPWVADNRLRAPGKAIHPVQARVKLGRVEASAEVHPGELGAVFELELEAGPAELWTWLSDEDGRERGAYFVYVERL